MQYFMSAINEPRSQGHRISTSTAGLEIIHKFT
jgi:hypothetical protein